MTDQTVFTGDWGVVQRKGDGTVKIESHAGEVRRTRVPHTDAQLQNLADHGRVTAPRKKQDTDEQEGDETDG